MMDTAVRLEDVTKQYRRTEGAGFILGPASIEIRSGAWVVFTGPSGAGKTTLLQLMALLDRPDAGRVCLFGNDITSNSESALSTDAGKISVSCISSSFSSNIFLFGRTCRDDCCPTESARGTADGKRPRSWRNSDSPTVWTVALDHSQVGSSSESAARAVIHGPRLLIADEPTSNVDAETAMEIFSFFKSLREQGTTLIVSTHDELLLELADHHYKMERGKILK